MPWPRHLDLPIIYIYKSVLNKNKAGTGLLILAFSFFPSLGFRQES